MEQTTVVEETGLSKEDGILTFSVREPSVRQPIVTPPYTKAVGPTPFTL